jgi:hypothetical protein
LISNRLTVPAMAILCHKEKTAQMNKHLILDNGGRRTGSDRRSYRYSAHLPERRNGKERRSGKDRRRMMRPR